MSNYTPDDLKKFNELAALLLQPFDDSELKTNQDGFTYVDPERYRYRLLKAFPNGFLFHTEDVKVGETGLAGYGHFVGEIVTSKGPIKYDIRSFVIEKFQLGARQINGDDNPHAGKPQKQDLSAQMFNSACLKSIATNIGLGLHLYVKAAQAGGNAGARSSGGSQSAPASTGPWTGQEKVNIGKFKGTSTTWGDVDQGYLDYVTRGDKPNQNALKEIARRQADAPASNSGGGFYDDNLDNEIPF